MRRAVRGSRAYPLATYRAASPIEKADRAAYTAEELPCTARATMFNSFIIAGHLVALLVAYLNGWQYLQRFYYNVRSFQTLPVYLLQKAAR